MTIYFDVYKENGKWYCRCTKSDNDEVYEFETLEEALNWANF